MLLVDSAIDPREQQVAHPPSTLSSPPAPPQPALRSGSKLAASKLSAPTMSMETSVAEFSQTLAGVVAVDGGTPGLEVRPATHQPPLHP